MAKTTLKSKKLKNDSEIKFVFVSAAFITLFINPKLTDPFNAPKMYLLLICSVILSGHIFFAQSTVLSFFPREMISKVTYIFVLVILIQGIGTDLKYAAIFGENQRQLGVLTYIGFSLFLIATFKFFRYEHKKLFQLTILFLGLFYVIYGIIQYSGNDPFNWINQYNPIIGTLGNPNFTAALMSIIVTLLFSFIFDKEINNSHKIIFSITSFMLILVIYLSDARQGILSAMAGIGVFLLLKIIKVNFKIGILSLFALCMIAFFVVAGILQTGPLEKYLYKSSVTLRGYYWRTGFEMFQNNFWSGVGIERFGANFRRYVDPNFPLNYGYELITNNAHNVPIQMFATGGIFLGISYLAIIVICVFYGLSGFKKLNGSQLNLLIGIFSAWIAFQVQSIVSIDNIGLTIWGWILTGAVVGISKYSTTHEELAVGLSSNSLKKKADLTSFKPVFTGAFLILTLITTARLTQSESVMFSNKSNFSQTTQNNQSKIQGDLEFIINDPFSQPYYKIESADSLYMLGLRDIAIESARKVVAIDPINPTYIGVLATMYEASGGYNNAIKQRINLINVDPNNAKNYLQLLRLYKQIGDVNNASLMLGKIISLTPNSEIAKLAKSEIQ